MRSSEKLFWICGVIAVIMLAGPLREYDCGKCENRELASLMHWAFFMANLGSLLAINRSSGKYARRLWQIAVMNSALYAALVTPVLEGSNLFFAFAFPLFWACMLSWFLVLPLIWFARSEGEGARAIVAAVSLLTILCALSEWV